jgi:hypothetical protein
MLSFLPMASISQLASNRKSTSSIKRLRMLLTLIYRYDNLFRLPQTNLQAFQVATGWSSNTKADPDLLVVEPGLYYELANTFNGSLVFTLSDGHVVVVPNEELTNPLRGIDTNGERVLNTNISEVNIFHQVAPLNTAVLGKVFLSQVSGSPLPTCSKHTNVHLDSNTWSSTMTATSSNSPKCPRAPPRSQRAQSLSTPHLSLALNQKVRDCRKVKKSDLVLGSVSEYPSCWSYVLRHG